MMKVFYSERRKELERNPEQVLSPGAQRQQDTEEPHHLKTEKRHHLFISSNSLVKIH